MRVHAPWPSCGTRGLDPADDLDAYGDACEIAAAAQRWVDAGTDTIVLQPAADDDIEEFVTFVGAEVQRSCAARPRPVVAAGAVP
jgi:hypothetical protein